jgi:hypothetical protein
MMQMTGSFPRQEYGFDEGALDFLALLRALKRLRYFTMEFNSYFGNPLEDEASYLNGFRAHDLEEARGNLPGTTLHSVHVVSEEPAFSMCGVDYWWGKAPVSITTSTVDFAKPHPVHGRNIDLFIETIDTIITWKRPQHLRCGPSMYFLNDHPLDKARSGLGWLGWLPFDISPSEVPEAAIVLPMQGGTFLASQRDWWIAAGPQRDEAAVQRAQALELRLNVLGVLPTNIELRRGDWGQGGVRP